MVEGAKMQSSGDNTLGALLARNASRHGTDIALREKESGIWEETTWAEYAEEVLECAAGLEKLGVAPGKWRRGLRKTLTTHGILDWFAVLKTADDGPSKPHPKILEDAMLEVGASPATTVMLGDTAYDMAMARSAGAHCLGVAWGYHAPSDLEAHGATKIIHKYADAPGAVREFLGGAA